MAPGSRGRSRNSALPTLEIHTVGATHAAAMNVVMLHGHDMHPDDLLPFADSLGVAARFVVPKAPHQVSDNGWSWWPDDAERRALRQAGGPRDLYRLRPHGRSRARAEMLGMFDELALACPGSNTVIVGFSQGGMLACDLLLHEALRVEAVALLSASCVAFDEWQSRADRMVGMRALVAHGRHDDRLSFSAGERLRDFLLQAGADVRWHPFEGGHEMPLSVWRQVRKLLHEIGRSISERRNLP